MTHIAHEAKFTPRNVQTPEERVKQVFAVKVQVPNPDHVLKAGMPADAKMEPARAANDAQIAHTTLEMPAYTPYPTSTPAPTKSPDATPTPEPTPTMEPTPTVGEPATQTVQTAVADAKALVTVNVLNLRAGPGTNYAKIGHVRQGDELKIWGKNPEGTWIKITAPDGTGAWVILTYVRVSSSLNDVPLVEVPPAPPSAP